MQDAPVHYGNFDAPFIDDLATHLRGRRVLEIFAGNGYLASLLAARGVDIQATSLFASHDGHERGFCHPVTEVDAVTAVTTLGTAADVLLVSWPTTTEAMAKAALAWGAERPIVFIGEVTDHQLGGMGLGGCASDRFFEITAIDRAFASYRGRGRLDRAVIMRVRAEATA